MLLLLLLLVSFSTLVLSQVEPGDMSQEQEKSELEQLISTLNDLSTESMRSLNHLNNSVPALAKECEKAQNNPGTAANDKIAKRVKAVFKHLGKLADELNDLHYKSVDVMELAMNTSSVRLAHQVTSLSSSLSKCETDKKAETAEKVGCKSNIVQLQSHLDKAKRERDEIKKERDELKKERDQFKMKSERLESALENAASVTANRGFDETCEREKDECKNDNTRIKTEFNNEKAEKVNLRNQLDTLRANCTETLEVQEQKCNSKEQQLQNSLDFAVDEKKKLQTELQKQGENCSSSLDTVNREKEECLKRSDEHKNMTQNECNNNLVKAAKQIDAITRGSVLDRSNLLKCNEDKNNSESKLLETKRQCNKTGVEAATCQGELGKCNDNLSHTEKLLAENVKTIEAGEVKFQNCEAKNKECIQNCEEQKNTMNDKLEKCASSSVTLEASLNGTKLELDSLMKEIEELKNATLSTGCFKGCEALENSSPTIRAQGTEKSFIIGKRQYIANPYVKLNWDEARQRCEAKGMAMIQIDNLDEFNQVTPKLEAATFALRSRKDEKLSHFWLGGKRSGPVESSTHEWLCGGKEVEVVNYTPRITALFKIRSDKLPCMSMLLSPDTTRTAYWARECEQTRLAYVCEKLIE